MRRFYFTIVSILFSSVSVFSQNSTKALERYVLDVRTGSDTRIPEWIYKDRRNDVTLLRRLNVYLRDSLDVIRRTACYLTKQIGVMSDDASIRMEAIRMLIQAINDRDTEICDDALTGLCEFGKISFSQNHRDSLSKYFIEEKTPTRLIMKLCGFLALTDVQTKLKSLAASANTFHKWTAHISLARMNDNESIKYLLNKLTRAPIDDDFVFGIVPDLVYTRQPEIFRFLETVIQSTQKSCHSANPDSDEKVECAFRVAEAIAPAIENFPYRIDSSGDLDTDDYPAALQNIRIWFKENPGYKIKTDTF